MTTIFDAPHTRQIVEARLAHLASLDLPISGLRTLEVGAGVGNLTGWFLARGCDVLATDGRAENVAEHRRRFPACRAEVVNLDQYGSHDRFGMFDLVVCYGVLYHLRAPEQVLADLANNCSGMLLLETEVNAADDQGECRLNEGAGADQSLCGFSIRLGRGIILRELRYHFPFAYISRTQPRHPWFPLTWPAERGRAIFVASRYELHNENLVTELPQEMTYD